MNIERIRELREFISKLPPEACDMGLWFRVSSKSPCGTIGCIGGWTNAMRLSKNIELEKVLEDDSVHSTKDAANYLELNDVELDNLFYSCPNDSLNWKSWILNRLDNIIQDNCVMPMPYDY